jgi:hypothetical protein
MPYMNARLDPLRKGKLKVYQNKSLKKISVYKNDKVTNDFITLSNKKLLYESPPRHLILSRY